MIRWRPYICMEGQGRIYEYFLLTNPPLLAPEVLRGGSGRGPKSGFVSTFTHFFCFGAPNPTFCTHKNCTIRVRLPKGKRPRLKLETSRAEDGAKNRRTPPTFVTFWWERHTGPLQTPPRPLFCGLVTPGRNHGRPSAEAGAQVKRRAAGGRAF